MLGSKVFSRPTTPFSRIQSKFSSFCSWDERQQVIQRQPLHDHDVDLAGRVMTGGE